MSENDVLREFLLEREDEVIKVMTIDMTFEAREEIIKRNAREESGEEGLISPDINNGKSALLMDLWAVKPDEE